STNSKKRLDIARILISTSFQGLISNIISMNIEREVFHVRVTEEISGERLFVPYTGSKCDPDASINRESPSQVLPRVTQEEFSISTIPCLPKVGRTSAMEVKPREEEGSLLSSKFNREEPSISMVPCSLEELKGSESENDIGGRRNAGKKEKTKKG
ncbi:hypothetical protein Ancab_008017, partial [Ancistrocladus abbreviatus]